MAPTLQNGKSKSSSTFTDVVQGVRDAFESGRTKPLEFREKQLKALLRMYDEHANEFIGCLAADIRKSKQEAISFELELLKNDVKNNLINLREWAKPKKPSKTFVNMLDDVLIYNDPYGVVLVMGAWNYPLQLCLLPMAGAIAAGNCVVLKPSEISPTSASLMAELLPKYLDQECYRVVLGGIPETTELLKERFDYIFYTGSTGVGKIVRTAANEHLTPVTLELGGKSPVYLDSTVNMEIAVRRILWGKYINAGQTCIAPDYLLCSKKVQQEFVAIAKEVIKEFYGNDAKDSPDFCRIVTDRHYHYAYNASRGFCNLPLDHPTCVSGPVPRCDDIGQLGALPENTSIYYLCKRREDALYPVLFVCPHGDAFNDTTAACDASSRRGRDADEFMPYQLPVD